VKSGWKLIRWHNPERYRKSGGEGGRYYAVPKL
jgi:hypothetical protein